MPPVKKQPKLKDDGEAARALALFAQNLDEVRRWYRAASHPGHEVGHVVMSEIVLTNVSVALEFALRGDRWTSPPDGP